MVFLQAFFLSGLILLKHLFDCLNTYRWYKSRISSPNLHIYRKDYKEIIEKTKELSKKVGIETPELYVISSNHLLMMAFSFKIKNKRAILINEQYAMSVSKDHLITSIAHELGHFKENDSFNIPMMVVVSDFSLNLILNIAMVFSLAKIGLPNSMNLAISFISASYTSYKISQIVYKYLSRVSEYRADQYAYRLRGEELFDNMMRELQVISPHSQESINDTHPTYEKRIKAVKPAFKKAG